MSTTKHMVRNFREGSAAAARRKISLISKFRKLDYLK
jgi:hypothetical protein